MRRVDTELLLDRYQILDRLGGGGFAEVFKAFDTRMRRLVAIKRMAASQKTAPRALREAQTVAQLNHPNIVTLYELEETSDYYYLIMELIEGTTLAEIIKTRSPMQIEDALSITYQVGAALEWAHQHDVIHRDIKPENVMLLPTGQVKVMDFGTARLRNSDLTREGDVVGTLTYMSPEQTQGAPADERSDLFSLGIMLYEMLTGQNPCEATTPAGTVFKILSSTPRPPGELNARLPAKLDAVVLKALAKDPSDRFDLIADFMFRLARATGIRDTVSSPMGRATYQESIAGRLATGPWGRSAFRIGTAAASSLLAWTVASWPPFPTDARLLIAVAIAVVVVVRPFWGLALLGVAATVPMVAHSLGLGLIYVFAALAFGYAFRKQGSAGFLALLTPFVSLLKLGLLIPFLAAFLFSPLIAGAAAGLGALVAEVWLLLSPAAPISVFPMAPTSGLWTPLEGAGFFETVTLLSTAFFKNPVLIYQPLLWFLVASTSSYLLQKQGAARHVVGVAVMAVGLFLGYYVVPIAQVPLESLLKTLSLSFIIGLFLFLLAPLKPPPVDVEPEWWEPAHELGDEAYDE